MIDPAQMQAFLAALPKAELHLHLEGAIEPPTAIELAARHGVHLTRDAAAARYAFRDFAGFLEAFKWVTSFLRTPADYALITERLAENLLRQNVIYAEVTLSVGVMLRRAQDVEANLAAIRQAAEPAAARGLRLQWIFDAVRQFGPDAAMDVARLAAKMKPAGVVAFGLGGDELALPAADFRRVYDYVAAEGLHRLVHAGEIGGPEAVREAVELLGAERIGHGIAAMRDAQTMDLLAARQVPLEICPTSNLRTGALARQLGRTNVGMEDHPMWKFLEHGPLFTISTDDPAMFGTSLNQEYGLLLAGGLSPEVAAVIAVRAATLSFLPEEEKSPLGRRIQESASSLLGSL